MSFWHVTDEWIPVALEREFWKTDDHNNSYKAPKSKLHRMMKKENITIIFKSWESTRSKF